MTIKKFIEKIDFFYAQNDAMTHFTNLFNEPLIVCNKLYNREDFGEFFYIFGEGWRVETSPLAFHAYSKKNDVRIVVDIGYAKIRITRMNLEINPNWVSSLPYPYWIRIAEYSL